MQDTFCAIIISYNPTNQLIENVNILIPQVSKILIVDNNSNTDTAYILDTLSKKESVTIKYNLTNLGIATALNQGVNYASENGYKWVVTFDQDSLASSSYIQTMIAAYESCDNNESIAIISPRYKTNTGMISFSKQKDKNLSFSKIKTTITSGNIIRVEALRKVGLFDDSFFIDYVDHEFCLRVRSNGWSIIESHHSILIHSLGNSTRHKIGNITIITTGHAPFRRYYKYRNLVRTIKKYYWFDTWLLKDLKALIFEPLKIILFEEEKLLKLGCIYKGVFDGIIGK